MSRRGGAPLLLLAAAILLLSVRPAAPIGSQPSPRGGEAYGDEFLLGVRMLGKSIRDTGATKDMVVLVSNGVSYYAKKLLQVVYLDIDTIVVKSMEDLFKCVKFCANLKHSERLNSGVMVAEPSETVFSDMMGKVQTLYSYTGGDQGFVNLYYSDFANAHLFDRKPLAAPTLFA
ncbi:hypothetical protein NL676_020486 [Syzygium grande]|nr:hypothetical protein NL676_020486 [Syzygium grande]